MVGDTLKKAGGDGEGLVTIKDLGDTEYGTSNVVMFDSSKDQRLYEILVSHPISVDFGRVSYIRLLIMIGSGFPGYVRVFFLPLLFEL